MFASVPVWRTLRSLSCSDPISDLIAASAEGRHLYARRAGIEGTLSQGVRAFGLRRSRYHGLVKTHLQHVAIAAAANLERLAA